MPVFLYLKILIARFYFKKVFVSQFFGFQSENNAAVRTDDIFIVCAVFAYVLNYCATRFLNVFYAYYFVKLYFYRLVKCDSTIKHKICQNSTRFGD